MSDKPTPKRADRPVVQCPRCGQSHDSVHFYEFTGTPLKTVIGVDAVNANWWGVCPITCDPILMALPHKPTPKPLPTLDLRRAPAGLLLERAVAAILGWTDLDIQESFFEHYGNDGWEDILTGYPPGEHSRQEFPRVSRRVEAAANLPLTELWFFDLHLAPNDEDYPYRDQSNAWVKWVYADKKHHELGDFHGIANRFEPALAMLRAWLNWREQVQK